MYLIPWESESIELPTRPKTNKYPIKLAKKAHVDSSPFCAHKTLHKQCNNMKPCTISLLVGSSSLSGDGKPDRATGYG